MRPPSRGIWLLATALLLPLSAAAAQTSCTGTSFNTASRTCSIAVSMASLNLNKFANVDVTARLSGDSLTAPTASAFTLVTEPASRYVEFTVYSNSTAGWELDVHFSQPSTYTAFWSYSGGLDPYGTFSYDKPVSDIAGGFTYGGTYVGLTPAGATPALIQRGSGATSGSVYRLYLATTYAFDRDRPGRYDGWLTARMSVY